MLCTNVEDVILLLKQRTVVWFVQNRGLATPELFYRYLIECKNGHFHRDYNWIINHTSCGSFNKLKHLKDQIASGVTTEFPEIATGARRTICLVLYWIIQYHSDKIYSVPSKSDIMDIFTSILERDILELW